MRQFTVIILGAHDSASPLHEATTEALHHAADRRGVTLNTRWMGPDDLVLYPGVIAEADGAVLAPPGLRTRRILAGSMLDALTIVRERDIPFLATGQSHGMVFIEVARRVLGLEDANSTYYRRDAAAPVVRELRTPSAPDGAPGRLREVELELVAHPVVAPLYGGPGRYRERTDVSHGLNLDYAAAIAEVGCEPVMFDAADRRPFLHVHRALRFHVTAAFLPQHGGASGQPHPLFEGLVTAALAAGADR